MVSLRAWLPVVVVAFSSLFSATSHASDLAAAEALFDEGRALMQQGNFDAACPKFEESQRLDPSAGTALNLALCYERSGRTATAWAQYQVAERLATTQAREEVAAEASRKAAELAPKLGTLSVQVAESAPGLEVQLGDMKLEQAALGSKIPVDAGSYTLHVTAPGFVPYQVDLTVADGRETNVAVPPLVPEPAERAKATPVEQEKPVERPPVPPRVRRPAVGNDDRTRAYLIGGGGVVLLGGSVVLGFLAKSKNDEARDLCGGRTTDCPHTTIERADAASSLANAGTVVGTLGILGIGAGAALLFTSQPSDAGVDGAARGWSLSLDRGFAGVGYNGEFE
jgi:hypothetical protein